MKKLMSPLEAPLSLRYPSVVPFDTVNSTLIRTVSWNLQISQYRRIVSLNPGGLGVLLFGFRSKIVMYNPAAYR